MRILFSVVILLIAFALPAAAKTSTPKSTVAPSFNLPTASGTVALDSLRGKVVLVDFWASWCEPCRKSFPWLKSMHERYASQGLAIVAINLDKSREPAEAFLKKYPGPFEVAFDPAGKTAEAFKVKAMPSSFIIGRNGMMLHTHTGFDPKKTAAVEALVQEALAP